MGHARADPAVTLIVVPRERFSFTERSLESIYEHTPAPFDLVYVDGRAPGRIRRDLECRARERGFHLVRTNHYLTPNQARNLGVQQARTKYIVFVDNDVLVTPGWLDALVACAEETEAWLVSPTICIGEPAGTMVHMAGGKARIQMEGGRRILIEEHHHGDRVFADVRPTMRREPSELVEFHTVLVRREVFARLGPLDEGLKSTREHVDFSLTVKEAGGTIYFEPESIVTYVPPPPFAWFDLPFYLTRWSEAWNWASLQHFRNKWKLGDDDPQLASQSVWLREHRRIVLTSFQRFLTGVCGRQVAERLEHRCLAPIEVLANRLICAHIRREHL